MMRLLAAGAMLALAGTAAAQEEAAPAEPAEIVVEGERPAAAEAPLGSRIGRARADFGNGQVASATGVAGLTPGSGMDPFAGGTRRRIQIECRSDAPITGAAACAFDEVMRAFEAGEHGAVRAGLDRILLRPALTGEERYIAHQLAYRLAVAEADEIDRAAALRAMIESGEMPARERAPALRTLAAIAIARGDLEAGVGWFERAVALAPDHAGSRGNLAALYAEAGREAEARDQLRLAIALTRAAGEAVPEDWIAFVGQR